MKQLIAIKQFLAFQDGYNYLQLTIGEIINKKFLLPLAREFRKSKNPEHKAEIKERIKELDKLKRNKKWKPAFANQIENLLKKRGQSAFADDFLADAAVKLFSQMDKIKLDPMTSTDKDIISYFASRVKGAIIDSLRKEYSMFREKVPPVNVVNFSGYSDDDNDNSGRGENLLNMLDDSTNKNNDGNRLFDELVQDLKSYMKREDKSGSLSEVFEAWVDAAERTRTKSEFKENNIIEDVAEDLGISVPGLYLKWKKAKQLIIKYFEKQVGYRLPNDIRKKYKLATVIAVEDYRRLVAEYVLSDVKLEMNKEGYATPEQMIEELSECKSKSSSISEKVATSFF